jgi:alpha-tubulin suppressor-like RCC1 family protein
VPALLTPDTSSTGGRKIAAGPQHGCAIDSGGAVHCWGLNSNGELGNGSHAPATEPAPVSGISSGASAVAAGGRHSCAVVTGQVRCWGSNTVGQLGNNDTASSNTPVTVSGINNAVAVAAGSSHNCALTTTGGVLCWGANGRGQLGNNSTTLSRVPVAVVGLGSGVAELALGFSHSCARLTSGALRCWGANSEGQLGNGESGSGVDQSVPNGVSGFGATNAASSAIALGAGDYHTCAVRPSGDLLCWGSNVQGQVGDGSGLPRRTTPVLVGGPLPQGWSGVDGGGAHTCAYRTSPARLACWGNNPLGELGTGSVGTASNVPVAVALAFSAFNLPVTLSLGANHSCAQLDPALPGAAQLLCWGNDQFGQIGDGGRGYDTPGLVLSDFSVFADGFESP